jgi:hypothetical protein
MATKLVLYATFPFFSYSSVFKVNFYFILFVYKPTCYVLELQRKTFIINYGPDKVRLPYIKANMLSIILN